jgi:hypothetical protein
MGLDPDASTDPSLEQVAGPRPTQRNDVTKETVIDWTDLVCHALEDLTDVKIQPPAQFAADGVCEATSPRCRRRL